MKKEFQIDIELDVPKIHNGYPILSDEQICRNLEEILVGILSYEVKSQKSIKVVTHAKVKKICNQ